MFSDAEVISSNKTAEAIAPDAKTKSKRNKGLKRKLEKTAKATDDTQQPVDEEHKKREQVLEYLTAWSEDRDNWKFKKHVQINIVRHIYDKAVVVPAIFKTAISYIKSIKGEKLLAGMTEEAETIVAEDEAAADTPRVKRAKRVLKALKSMCNPNK
ncbi:hypothetical protein HK101_001339 [Irineochytrium annulatum]|nr:hypothetical protein HK101_001339 [Irineochytrium annulatum]